MKAKWLWVAALACGLPYLGFWIPALLDLDEGFYAAVTRDMMQRGDWITPTLNGQPWFEKPVLLYWLAIPSVIAFGDVVGPRLPSVLAALGLAFVLYRFARTWFDEETGLLAAVVFSGSLLVVGTGRMMLTDAVLNLSLSGCLLLFWASLHDRPNLRWGSAACLGLAILAKGPVAGAFFLIIAGLAFYRLRTLRGGFRGGWLVAIPVLFLVVAAWYLPCWLVNGQEFVQEFLIEQNVGRFTGGDLAHKVPWFLHPIYYPLILALALLPWIFPAVKGGFFIRPPLNSTDPADLLRRYLWIWALTIVVFFSISGSKLPHYILPAMTPLALLAADAIRRRPWPTENWLLRMALPWSAFVCIAAYFAFGVMDRQQSATQLHQLTAEMRGQAKPLLVYRLGRNQSNVEIKLELNETSRPSIGFTYPGPLLAAWEFEEAFAKWPEGDFLVLSRPERISSSDRDWLSEQGYRLEEIGKRSPFAGYRLVKN